MNTEEWIIAKKQHEFHILKWTVVVFSVASFIFGYFVGAAA